MYGDCHMIVIRYVRRLSYDCDKVCTETEQSERLKLNSSFTNIKFIIEPMLWSLLCTHLLPPSGRGTVVSIVSCWCTYCCFKASHGKITRHYSRYCTVAFCCVQTYYMCPGHGIKLHLHWVKLYRIGCVWSGMVLAKALT